MRACFPVWLVGAEHLCHAGRDAHSVFCFGVSSSFQASYLNSVRAAWANVTGEVEAGITVGTIADGVLQPPFLVGRSDMERKVLEVIYGHVRALLAYSRELTQHWVDFLHSDFQE